MHSSVVEYSPGLGMDLCLIPTTVLSKVRRGGEREEERKKSDEEESITSKIIKCMFMRLLIEVLFVMATY